MTPFKKKNISLIEISASEFVHSFGQQFLLLYSDQDSRIAQQKKQKKVGESAAALIR